MNNKKTLSLLAGIMACTLPVIADDAATLEKLNARITALESSAKESTREDKVKIKGDLRYRYEFKAKDGDTSSNRHRIRARIGAYADVNEQTQAGIRIATGDSSNPTSTNNTIGDSGKDSDYFKKNEIWIDLAYLTYHCNNIEGLSATFGKMKQPWDLPTDLIFDGDVNPEGISLAYEADFDGLALTSQFGYLLADEKKGDDVELFTAQVAGSIKLSDEVKLNAGISGFVYNNIDSSAVPSLGTKGNSATAGNYDFGYELIDGFVEAKISKGPAPIKLYAEYLNNLAADVEGDTAWILGVGTKVKDLSLEYNYRDVESDAILGALSDGDIGGTDGKAHKIKAKYPIAKNFTAGATYFRIEDRTDTDVDLFQFDLVVKF